MAEFIQDGQSVGQTHWFAIVFFLIQGIDEFNRREKTHPTTMMYDEQDLDKMCSRQQAFRMASLGAN
jgi:hypothetical protein